MKYGIMYYKATDNLGDDIQTYCAKKYLPHIDYYIDREALSCFVPKEKEYVSMIMNGWFIHNKVAWPPSPYINPLLISMHFKESNEYDVGNNYLKEFGSDFLKKYGPVGARDIETKNRLEKNGIKAYLSGCMTLTLDKFEYIEKKDKICIVDVREDIVGKIKQNTQSEIEVLTHYLNPEETEKKTFYERMNYVEKILKKYQEAKLVITSRLHTLLPCVALGVPVIVLHKKNYDKDRLEIFMNFVNEYVEDDFINENIKDILQNPKPNSNEYLEMRNLIDSKCKEYIEKCENMGNYDLHTLPNIGRYRKYVKNIKWYKGIYEKERCALESLSKKREEEFNLYKKENEKLYEGIQNLLDAHKSLKAELETLKEKNHSLANELETIYNSRSWRYMEKIRSIILNHNE